VASIAALGLLLTACAAPNSGSTATRPAASAAAGNVPVKPSAPVTLDILDVAGNQKLTGSMVTKFVKEHPDIISSVTWESAGAPDLVGTIKPQVDSKKLSVDLVMTGTDGLSAGIDQNLWVPIVKDYGDRLSNMANYIDPAARWRHWPTASGS
jgi:putative spermidine/putrescine transport system substrate-binding protein